MHQGWFDDHPFFFRRTMIQVELINDQPQHSGTGVYAWNLFNSLKSLVVVRMSFYDSLSGSCFIIGQKNEVAQPQVRFSKIKPLFWWECHRRFPHQGLAHFVSQNLSFLKTEGVKIVTCLDLIPLIMPESFGERLWRRLLYSGIKKADHIIAISAHTKHDLIRLYRMPPERITVTHLGVSPEFHPRNKDACRRQLGLPAEDKIVLHVGTAARRKNFSAACRAFALIKRKIKDVILLKVGGVSEADRRRISLLGLEDCFILRDRVPASQLPLYYAAADVFLFPSRYEGFGLPVLEAMASGCPVVASNATSLPEVLGEAGLMHHSEDVVSLASSVMRILEDVALRDRLVEAGLRRAAEFTWERTARETAAVYRLVLEERN